jgi:hypothetical protein
VTIQMPTVREIRNDDDFEQIHKLILDTKRASSGGCQDLSCINGWARRQDIFDGWQSDIRGLVTACHSSVESCP